MGTLSSKFFFKDLLFFTSYNIFSLSLVESAFEDHLNESLCLNTHRAFSAGAGLVRQYFFIIYSASQKNFFLAIYKAKWGLFELK